MSGLKSSLRRIGGPVLSAMRMGRAYAGYSARVLFYRLRFPGESVFTTIHRKRSWGRESVSGGGSDLVQTERVRALLSEFVRQYEVRTLVDAPCGDFYWMSSLALELDRLIGLDIVEELIEQNREHYASDRIRFEVADITRDPLPRADLILCRDCLVHLSFRDIHAAVRNMKGSGSTYLLTTTYPGLLRRNHNIVTGMWRPIDLQLKPFRFPPPLRIESEECTEETDYPQKSLALWRLDDLPSAAR